MKVQRLWRVFPAAIALAGLVSLSMNAASAADLQRYISPDFCAAVVIHPEQIGKSTLSETVKSAMPPQMAGGDPGAGVAAALQKMQELPKGMDVDKLVKSVPWKSIHRIVLFVDSTMAKDTPGGAVIVQFSSDFDGETFVSALTTDQQPAETNGVKYAKLKDKPGEPDGAVLAPDNRTLIFGVESTVVKMLAKNEGDRPLLKLLQRASLKHDILIEFCAEPLRAGLIKSTDRPMSDFEKMLNNLGKAKEFESLSVQLDFSGKSLLHGELTCDKPETATMLATQGKSQVDGAKQQFAAMKQQPPPLVPPAIVPALSKLGDEIFAGLEIKSEGPRLTVELAMPDSLPDALKAAAQIGAGMMGGPARAPGVKR